MRKTVLNFSEGDGLFSLGIEDKQEALQLMKEWWDSDPEWHAEKYDTPRFSEDEIVKIVHISTASATTTQLVKTGAASVESIRPGMGRSRTSST